MFDSTRRILHNPRRAPCPREIDSEVVAVRITLYQRADVNASLRKVAEAYLGSNGSVGNDVVGPDALARITAPALVYPSRASDSGVG